jgi:dolichyl-phosphooligosaccharide-protein glycotransferase
MENEHVKEEGSKEKEKVEEKKTEKDKEKKSVQEKDIQEKTQEEKEEIITIKKSVQEVKKNLNKVSTFVLHHKAMFLLIIVLLITFLVRVGPLTLSVLDERAQERIDEEYGKRVQAGIQEEFPQATPKDVLLFSKQVLEKEKEKVEYKEKIEETSAYFKSLYQDNEGVTYLLGSDPPFWMRYVRNIVKTGHAYDELRDGKRWDTHMFAPRGREITRDVLLHPQIVARFYQVMSIFNPNSSLESIARFTPVILMLFCSVLLFFIVRVFAGDMGAFFAALFLGLAKPLILKTSVGFIDTDPYVILFPLFITFCCMRAYYASQAYKKIIYLSCAALGLGLFSITWKGWLYFPLILLTSLAVFLCWKLVVVKRAKASFFKDEEVKKIAFLMLVFGMAAFIFISFFYGFEQMMTIPLKLVKASQVESSTRFGELWPNVLTTVAELETIGIKKSMEQLGGNLVLGIALLGSVFFFFRKRTTIPLFWSIFFLIWTIISLYTITRGLRFLILAVPMIAFFFGYGTRTIYAHGKRWLHHELHMDKRIISVVLILILFLTMGIIPFPPFCAFGACNQAMEQKTGPLLDDSWMQTFTDIKQNTAKDAIITSWWDFGHWIKYGAERRVTFDGASQSRPQAYWVGKFFLTSSEKEAISILRMLDCSAELAYEDLNAILEDPLQSVNLIHQIILLEKEEARNVLQARGLTQEQQEHTLAQTHCDPPEAYVITSKDMINKADIWAHFGLWNFEKAFIWQELRNLPQEEAVKIMQEKLQYSQKKAEETYFTIQSFSNNNEANNWIAPWPEYGSIRICDEEEGLFFCTHPIENKQVQLIIDPVTEDAYVKASSGKVWPSRFVYSKGDEVIEKVYKGEKEKTMKGAIMVVRQSDGSLVSIASQPELATSMFTRLFIFNGQGLEHFTPFSHYSNVITAIDVKTWKVEWEGKP